MSHIRLNNLGLKYQTVHINMAVKLKGIRIFYFLTKTEFQSVPLTK